MIVDLRLIVKVADEANADHKKRAEKHEKPEGVTTLLGMVSMVHMVGGIEFI